VRISIPTISYRPDNSARPSTPGGYGASSDVDGATSGYEHCFVADSFSFGVEEEMNKPTDDGLLTVDDQPEH
jgi:hypothetical protein